MSDEEEIEEKDERYIAIGNAAMALGLKVMTTLILFWDDCCFRGQSGDDSFLYPVFE